MRIDYANRADRMAASASSAAASPSPGRPSNPVRVEVWVPDADGGIDRVAERTGGPTSADRVVHEALENGQRVLDYVHREFGRDSFDGRGATLKLRVHAPDPTTGEPNANNAFWFDDEQRIWLGDGDGVDFMPLGGGPDVVAHEFFHGVMDAENKMTYEGQEGALHESFADVLATGVDGNWQIGESVYTPGIAGDALRDIAHLTFTDWRAFPSGEDEVHAMSEVTTHAAFLAASTLGAVGMRKVWYTALTDHLRNHSGFAGARDATIAASRVIYGARSAEVQAVADAWAAVGIDASTPKDPPLTAAQAALGASFTQPPLSRLF